MRAYATAELRQQRDERIWERRREGGDLREIAAEFGISYALASLIARKAPERAAQAKREATRRKQPQMIEFWQPPKPKPPQAPPRDGDWRTAEQEWYAIQAGL